MSSWGFCVATYLCTWCSTHSLAGRLLGSIKFSRQDSWLHRSRAPVFGREEVGVGRLRTLAHPSACAVLAGLALSVAAVAGWAAIGPLVEAAHAGTLPGLLGTLLGGLMERRAERPAAAYVSQVRMMVDGPLLLAAGAGLLPLAARVDSRAGSTCAPPRSPEGWPATVAGVVAVTFTALVAVEGLRFAVHVAAGGLLLLTLIRSAAEPTHVRRTALDSRHGASDWLAVAAIVSIAAAVRLPGLGLLDPYTDEYYHLFAALELLTSGTTEYARAPLVTGLVALSTRLAGATAGMGGDGDLGRLVATARMPFALAGALTVVPLMLLARRVDRTVGLVAGVLWALSPWAIGLSRTVREYALFPLLALTFALALMTLIEAGPLWKRRTVAAAFAVTFVAVLLVDRRSTLIMGALPSLLSVSTWALTERGGRWLARRSVVIAAMAAGVIGLVVLLVGGHVGVTLRPQYVRAFIAGDGTPLHWWGAQTATPLFVGLMLLAGLYAASRRGLLTRLAGPLAAFVLPLLAVTFLLDRYYAARYASALLPWFTIIVATASVVLGRELRDGAGGRTAILAVVALVAVSVRPFDVSGAVFTDRPGTLAATGEFHLPVRDLLAAHASTLAGAQVVITVPHLATAMELVGVRRRDDTRAYEYLDPDRFETVAHTMRTNLGGLMLLDGRRNGLWQPGFPREGFTISTPDESIGVSGGPVVVDVVVDDGFLQLYRWQSDAGAGR